MFIGFERRKADRRKYDYSRVDSGLEKVAAAGGIPNRRMTDRRQHQEGLTGIVVGLDAEAMERLVKWQQDYEETKARYVLSLNNEPAK